ncbi:MAG: hypothetical protein SH807_06405 [Blastochloris sp.]|nr:hypothetical protein [Blastochloris sp.]
MNLPLMMMKSLKMNLKCVLLIGLVCATSTTDMFAQTESDSIIQKEVLRRQELVLRALKELDEAQQMAGSGKEEEARKVVLGILEVIPNTGEGVPVYQKAATIMATLEYKAALKKFGEKDYFEARKLAQSSIKYRPSREASNLLANCNAILGIKKGDKPENPAVDAKFISSLKKVEDHIALSQKLTATGQYDLAEKELEQALALDPYNKVAAVQQEKLYKKMGKSLNIAQKSSRQEALTKTREGWSEIYAVDTKLPGTQVEAIPIKGKLNFQVSQKLQSLIIDEVNFENATIDDAAQFLTAKTRAVDDSGAGISFIIKNEKARADAKPFSLRLNNVPAGEVLRYICNIAGVKYKVEEFAVFIVPLSDGDDAVMITREFPVRDTFFDAINVGTADAPAGGARARRPRTAAADIKTEDPIRKSLVDRGVQFPTGSAAIYNRATGTLTIKNTQDQVDLVEELVTIDQGETLLVRVETKLIEINQIDLDSLAFNYNLAGSYPLGVSGTQIAGGAVSTGTALLGAKGVKPADGLNTVMTQREGLDSASNPRTANAVPNRLGISGAIDGNAFRALMEALSQKTSTDLMTAPAVLVNDGQQANILVARQFFYPTTFEQADASVTVAQNIVGNILIGFDERTVISTLVIPSWPSEFVARNVGVSMVVQPRITVDRQRVFLTLKPEITEFDGFINYGSSVNALNNDGESTVITPNTINQPVFTTRTVDNAQLEIQDGYTMVLGGLIREDISTVDDKVPILGDIPIIGRLFRSKAEQAIKKNMLIFVTVRILRPDGEPYNIDTAPAIATGN